MYHTSAIDNNNNNNNNNFNSNILVRFFRNYLQTIYNLNNSKNDNKNSKSQFMMVFY